MKMFDTHNHTPNGGYPLTREGKLMVDTICWTLGAVGAVWLALSLWT